MKRKIVILGTRRSGSTFIGKLLSESVNSFVYIEEPFNPVRGIKSLEHVWYPYLNERNEKDQVKQDLYKLLNLKSVKFKNSIVNNTTKESYLNVSTLRVVKEVFDNKSKETFKMRMLRVFFKSNHYISYLKAKYSNKKYIVYKDVLMSLAVKELIKQKDVFMIFIYRNPLGFYYSMKRLNWAISSDNFLKQQELIKDYPFIKDMPRETEIDRIINEWIIVNSILLEQSLKNDNIICVAHEKIALEPEKQISKIFEWLEISKNINEEKIKLFTNGDHKTQKTKDVKRDSKKEVSSWHGKISDFEVNHIKKRTNDLFEKLNNYAV